MSGIIDGVYVAPAGYGGRVRAIALNEDLTQIGVSTSFSRRRPPTFVEVAFQSSSPSVVRGVLTNHDGAELGLLTFLKGVLTLGGVVYSLVPDAAVTRFQRQRPAVKFQAVDDPYGDVVAIFDAAAPFGRHPGQGDIYIQIAGEPNPRVVNFELVQTRQPGLYRGVVANSKLSGLEIVRFDELLFVGDEAVPYRLARTELVDVRTLLSTGSA